MAAATGVLRGAVIDIAQDGSCLAARGWTDWLAVAVHVLLRRSEATPQVTRRTCRELRLDTDRAHLWELDGEVMGSTRQLVVTIRPGVLLVRVPA